MTWRLYALGSAGAFLATYFVSVAPPVTPRQPGTSPRMQAADSGAVIDLNAQAERLHVRMAGATEYREPSRNAFRFAAREPRPSAESVTSSVASGAEATPIVAVPARLPFALAGVASSMENGVPQFTAILTSLRGVQLVKDGEPIDGGYRVVSIAEDAVTIESTSDGTRTTIGLSDSEPR